MPHPLSKLLLVLGAYGAGTTALTAALAHLGVPAAQPFHTTNDPRTEISYEYIDFRETILRLVDEERLALRDLPAEDRLQFLRDFDTTLQATGVTTGKEGMPYLLKFPPACLCLPLLSEIFDLQLLLIHRTFEEIEQSRERRGWPPRFGAAGASILYNIALTDMITLKRSWLSVSYEDLTTDPEAPSKKSSLMRASPHSCRTSPTRFHKSGGNQI